MTTHVVPPATLTLTALFQRSFPEPASVQFSAPGGYFDLPTPMFLNISQTGFLFSPISTYVVLYNAKPGATAYFYIDGDLVATRTVDSGRKAGVTLTSGPLTRGTHWIMAECNGVTVRLAITLYRAPNIPLDPIGADRPPEIVVGAETNGRYHWVLQDLAFQGIGSWIMPLNPVSMQPLPNERTLSATPTAAVEGGMVHVTEGAPVPKEWSFAGYCPDFSFYAKLSEYADLDRKFYLIDHRNRAWTVTFTNVDFVPRKRIKDDDGTYNDWTSDYTVKAVIYDPQSKTPE